MARKYEIAVFLDDVEIDKIYAISTSEEEADKYFKEIRLPAYEEAFGEGQVKWTTKDKGGLN
jgi:hypothetical protein